MSLITPALAERSIKPAERFHGAKVLKRTFCGKKKETNSDEFQGVEVPVVLRKSFRQNNMLSPSYHASHIYGIYDASRSAFRISPFVIEKSRLET